MFNLLPHAVQDAIRPFLKVMNESVWNLDVSLDLTPEFPCYHRSFAGLAVLLWPLAGRSENQVCYWVVVVSDRMAAEAAGFERDCTTTRERIKHGGNLAVVRSPHELPSNAKHFPPLVVLRIGNLPFHEGAVVEQFLRRRCSPALPGVKLELLRRPLGDECQEAVARRVLDAVVGSVRVLVMMGGAATTIVLQTRGNIRPKTPADRRYKFGRTGGIVRVGHQRREHDRACRRHRPSCPPNMEMLGM